MVELGRVSSRLSCFTSLTTPTTSRTLSGVNVRVTWRPSGFSFGQERLAMDSLIRIVDGRPTMSEFLKSRPRSTAIRSADMYPGLMRRTSTSGCSDMGDGRLSLHHDRLMGAVAAHR